MTSTQATNSPTLRGTPLADNELSVASERRHEEETRTAGEKPYSVFTNREKWILIGMTSYAALLSPLSSAIYFPALPTMAKDFSVSVSLINLTVTFYLIFQGLSPMLWGSLADAKGRRPIYLGCTALLSVTCVALALTPTSHWWLLLIFRCIQSSGSASTVALGLGVIADVTTRAERGGFMGVSMLGPLLGPSLGPVIGGLLAGSLSWRWIFWFLCILAGSCFVALLLFLPETLRLMVGDGSIPPPKWNRPLIPVIGPRHSSLAEDLPPQEHHRSSNPFRFFLEFDVLCVLLCNGLIFALLSGVQASASLLLQRAHPGLTQVTVGLCFLPLGIGCVISALVTGKQLNWSYAKSRSQWEAAARQRRELQSENKLAPDAPWTKEEELTFHIEKTRLGWALAYGVIASIAAIIYGWVLHARTNLAVPLIFLFFIGYVMVAQMNSVQTLLIDIFPGHGAATTAINNCVRCLLAAGTTAIVEPILNALGVGWTFVLFGGICLVICPLTILAIIRFGPGCRARRVRRGAFGL